MLAIEHSYRVNHVDLVHPSFLIYFYEYEAPVTMFLIVTW